jgi:hypothetical protein
MADTKTVLDIKIESAQAAKTIRDLTSSLKALKEEQSNVTDPKEWKRLTQTINDTEGKLGDLNDSFKTLTGSGVDRVNASIGLFKEGLMGFDFGKIGLGLKGLGAAFKSVLPFFLVEGIMKLIESFDELKTSGGLIGKVFSAIGTAIDAVGDAINWLTDKIHLTNTALDKQGEALKTNADKSKEALDGINAEYDRQIALISASGKSTVEIEKKKQQAILDTTLELIKQNLAYQEASKKAGKNVDEENLKLLQKQINDYKNAKNQLAILDAKEEKTRIDSAKKVYEEKKKIQDKEREDRVNDLTRGVDDERKAAQQIKKDKEFAAQELLAQKNKEFADAQAIKKYWDDLAKAENDKIEKERIELKEAYKNVEFQLERDTLSSLQALSDTYFSIKQANLKKGSAAEEAAAKRQFQINKAFSIASAVISGYQGVVDALSAKSTVPEPFGQILKVANAISIGLATVANVAKISATQFDTKGYASSQIPSPSNSGGGGGQNIPSINTQAPTTQASTMFDAQGNVMNQKIVVSVEEINQKQGRVARLEEQATI